MVLTDRQRSDLHAGIYEYLCSRGEAFAKAAEAFAAADPDAAASGRSNGNSTSKIPLLEKKWTAIPRLQKKVLELERQAAHNAKIHAHRSLAGGGDAAGGPRRFLPRLPCTHSLQGHSMVVTCVKVHPVFTIVASGSEDGTIKIWDHESGEYMRTLKGHTNTVNALSFSPTGTHLASCSTDLSIKLWDFTTFACTRTLRGHDHTISSVLFVPTLFEGNSGVKGTSSTSTGVDAVVAGAQHLLSASRDQTVKLWDVETGFCDQTFNQHTDWVRCLAVRQHAASDGSYVWASAGNDPAIFVYEKTSEIAELRGHEHVVEALAFLTEEAVTKPGSINTKEIKHIEQVRDYLVSGSRDRTVRLWKISEGTCLSIFKAHENWVRSVVLHPSGNYIISSSDDKSIRVFDIKAQRCLRTMENAHNHFVTCIDMHHTLPILVSGGVDQAVRCWQLD